MIPVGHKIEYNKITRKGYDCENCVYVKYGKEQKIRDFVNAGRAGTEAKKVIGKTVDMEELRKMCKEIPEQTEIVNMNLNPYMADKIAKVAKTEYKKLQEFRKQQEILKQQEEMKKQEKPKGDDVNE